MTDCRFCGTPGAYDSGFSVECANPSCSMFSQKQADIVSSSASPVFVPVHTHPLSRSLFSVPRCRFMIAPQVGHWEVEVFSGKTADPYERIHIFGIKPHYNFDQSHLVSDGSFLQVTHVGHTSNPHVEVSCDGTSSSLNSNLSFQVEIE